MGKEILDRVEELQTELWAYIKDAKVKNVDASYQDLVTVFMLLKIAQIESLINRKY